MSDPTATFERLTKRTQPKPELTERQREVLALVGMGATYPEIGAKLDITARTAKFHTDKLRRLFSVQNKRDLIPEAHRLGLV